MSIVKQLLGEGHERGFDGVVYSNVLVRLTTKDQTLERKPVPGAGPVIELSFPGNPSTTVLGISPEAARKLADDILAILNQGAAAPGGRGFGAAMSREKAAREAARSQRMNPAGPEGEDQYGKRPDSDNE